jgi:hypothetical protein
MSSIPRNIKVHDFLTKVGRFAKENFGSYEIREGNGSLKIEFYLDHQDHKHFEPAMTFTVYHKEYLSKSCLVKLLKTMDREGFTHLKEKFLQCLNN